MKAAKWFGRASGVTQVGTSGYELYNNYQNNRPIAGSIVKLGVSLLSLRVNPTVGLIMGIVDATGGTQYIYRRIDNYVK